MSSRKIKILICVIILGIGVAVLFIFLSSGKPNEVPVITASKEVIKAPVKRKWADDFLQEEYPLHSGIHDSVFRGVAVDKIGNYLYVTDGDMSLKRFTLEGDYKDRFGKGRGRGPGEVTMFVDFTILGDDRLYIADTGKRKVMQFDLATTKYETSFPIKYDPIRVAAVNDSLVVESLLSGTMFKVHTAKGTKIRAFGHLIDKQIANSMSVYGDIREIPGTPDFISVAVEASFIFYFNLKGELLKTVKMADRIPFKSAITRSSDNTQTIRSPIAKVENEDVNIFDNKIYVSVSKRKDIKTISASWLDVFDLETGHYLHSIKLPYPVTYFALSHDLIYLLGYETTAIRAFNYQEVQ